MSFRIFAPGRATADVGVGTYQAPFDPERAGSMQISPEGRLLSNWEFEGENLNLTLTLNGQFAEVTIVRGAEKLIELINSMNASVETFSFDEEEDEPIYDESEHDTPAWSDLTSAFSMDAPNIPAYTHTFTPLPPFDPEE